MGPGPRSKYFFEDRGFEFINIEVILLYEANGIRLLNTSSYSPWSNCLNERNHSVVDVIISKMKQDDPSVPLSRLLDIALFCKNSEPNNRIGSSPLRLVTGRDPIVSTLLDNPTPCQATGVSDSETVRNSMQSMHVIRKAFREVDCSERI